MPSADVLERLQALYLADDLEVPESALAWTEEEAHTFFDSGGLKRPAPAPSPAAAPAPDPPAAPPTAAPPDGRLRWVVDITAWEPGEAEWAALLRQLPEVDSTKVMKYRFRDDQKRAMASRLLQRRASADVFGIAPAAVRIERTKGSKPYLANPRKNSPRQPTAAAAAAAAPNWNFNVSHEGNFVVLAAEPLLLCGVDVAAPGQLRRGDKQRPLEEVFRPLQSCFADAEWAAIRACGPEERPMEMCFRKHWSLKEAFTKARGDGIAFELKRCAFTLRGAAADAADTATVEVDGVPLPEWSFFIQDLGADHWVSVARGPPDAAVDELGGFRATFARPQPPAAEADEHRRRAEPPFAPKAVAELSADALPAG